MDKYSFREPKTSVPLQPIMDGVLIKISYNLSIIGLSSEKLQMDASSLMEIAGYGEITYGFEIGDVVTINHEYKNAAPFIVMVPGNKRSYAERHKMYGLLPESVKKKLREAGGKYLCEDYMVVPRYAITAYTSSADADTHDMKSLIIKKPTSEEAIDHFNTID